jgi:tetratricopeptide (TPR) repeat protein
VREPTLADKRAAQDSALRAATLLDEGKEAEAKLELEKARKLDPNNALAETLRFSITADPTAVLGPKYFKYTVQPNDRLSKLSEQYLKDQYKFYLLARYNDLSVPRLRVGQVIRIPGAGPIRPVQKPPTTTVDTTRPKPSISGEAERLYQEAMRRLQAGDKEGAYDLFSRASLIDAKYRGDADRVRAELISIHDRKAREAYKRQELDLCIQEWTRVLQLDPSNEIASIELRRAQELDTQLRKVSGG